MDSGDHRELPESCVEFKFRVYSDGRRERHAVVLLRGQDGVYRPGPSRPSGDLGRFVRTVIDEARNEVLMSRRRR